MGTGFFPDETYVFAYDSVSFDGVNEIILGNAKDAQNRLAEVYKYESSTYSE